jgi:hypothetical protein
MIQRDEVRITFTAKKPSSLPRVTLLFEVDRFFGPTDGWSSGTGPPHKSKIVGDFLARIGITVLDQSPYSPYLAPADFWFFPKVMWAMNGDHHDTIQVIQRECTAVLTAIARKEYSDCFQKLLNRFQLCTDPEGDYFE